MMIRWEGNFGKRNLTDCLSLKFFNRSLRKLGLPTVTELPEPACTRGLEDIARLAFTLIDPIVFPAPPRMLTEEFIDIMAADHARRMADQYREKVETRKSIEEKPTYFAGVLDAQVLSEADQRSCLVSGTIDFLLAE